MLHHKAAERHRDRQGQEGLRVEEGSIRCGSSNQGKNYHDNVPKII